MKINNIKSKELRDMRDLVKLFLYKCDYKEYITSISWWSNRVSLSRLMLQRYKQVLFQPQLLLAKTTWVLFGHTTTSS